MLGALTAAWRDQSAWGILTLTSVAGTNTITATLASAGSVTFGPLSYLTGAKFWLIPANTNTGATTLNVTSPAGGSALGAKNVFWNGAACVGGELRQNVPALVGYDGTQFHIIANGFNAPFLDTHPVVEGSGDSTKKFRIEADGITTATTRVGTVPDYDFTFGQVGVKVGSFTRDISIASGTQAVTGVGFTPKAVVFFTGLGAANETGLSVGGDDGTTGVCVYNNAQNTATAWGANGSTASIVIVNAAGTSYAGKISAFGADGFTVTWTKTGSPVGTYIISYLAFR